MHARQGGYWILDLMSHGRRPFRAALLFPPFRSLSSTPSETGGSTETVDGQEISNTVDLSVAIRVIAPGVTLLFPPFRKMENEWTRREIERGAGTTDVVQ
jgi:hypothetical protein